MNITIKEIRTLTGLSQAKFSKKYNIPQRTIESWEAGNRHCPDYVIELLEYRVRADISCNIKKKGGRENIEEK